MEGKSHSDEISEGNEEHVIGHWQKGNPCKWQRTWLNYVQLCSVLWEIELVRSQHKGQVDRLDSKEGLWKPAGLCCVLPSTTWSWGLCLLHSGTTLSPQEQPSWAPAQWGVVATPPQVQPADSGSEHTTPSPLAECTGLEHCYLHLGFKNGVAGLSHGLTTPV